MTGIFCGAPLERITNESKTGAAVWSSQNEGNNKLAVQNEAPDPCYEMPRITQDLGFDADVELEDKNKELLEQIDSLRARTNELQVAVVSAKDFDGLRWRPLYVFSPWPWNAIDRQKTEKEC